MEDHEFILEYINRYRMSLLDCNVSNEIIKIKQMWLKIKNTGNKVIIVGNGGSASIASHVAVDLTKQGKIRSVNFNYDKEI